MEPVVDVAPTLLPFMSVQKTVLPPAVDRRKAVSAIATKRGITRLIDQERTADHCDGNYESWLMAPACPI
jgi:hypothetical protein